jgi:hypothetical protein
VRWRVPQLAAALEERSLWIRLDLSANGVSPKRKATDALLHATAARARGELVALDISGCTFVTFDALLAAVTANGGTLRELRTRASWAMPSSPGLIDRAVAPSQPLDTDALEALLRAAPRLTVCEADVRCTELALARRLLRNEPPFEPLHVRTLAFHPAEHERDEAAVVALAADLPSHAHLRRLELLHAPLNTAAALDAVVDAALTRQLTSVALRECDLTPESAPALVRLIGGGALAELDIFGNRVAPHIIDPVALLDVTAARALGDALRASSTLTAVSLRFVRLWHDLAAATALLGALTGHPSLRSLGLFGNGVGILTPRESGAVIAALVAANAPALTELDVSCCNLGNAGARPLFGALPANTHLRTLDCGYNWLSNAFLHDSLLPAVRANASLRELKTGFHISIEAATEAEALVRRRADAE